MSTCTNCGLLTGNKHSTHDSLKECMQSAKNALIKLSLYRLLEGNEEEMSEQLRQETLEIAMHLNSKTVHNTFSINSVAERLKAAEKELSERLSKNKAN